MSGIAFLAPFGKYGQSGGDPEVGPAQGRPDHPALPVPTQLARSGRYGETESRVAGILRQLAQVSGFVDR